MPGAYEFVEGATSDLAFEARASSLEDVFAAAASALLAATVDEPDTVERRERHDFTLAEPDLELLLLRFLNELIYLRDAEALLLHPERIRIERGDPLRLRAELAGEPIDRARHALGSDVKAATAHGLRVAEDARGWTAHVTLDV